jgi:hypothetical protein
MTADIIHLGVQTTAEHRPDDILERAKGEGFDAVIVIGLTGREPLWVSGSTSDMERLIFMLDWAKRVVMDGFLQQVREREDETGGAA